MIGFAGVGGLVAARTSNKVGWALHTAALTQARRDDRARAFLVRKRGEGKTPREARVALKRDLAVAIDLTLVLDA